MTHFLFLAHLRFFISVLFAVFSDGTTRERVIYGLKSFLQFVVISLAIAWLLYFIPW